MRVYVATPCLGPIDPAYVSGLVGFTSLVHMAGGEVELDLISNCSLIAKARSEAALRFLDSGFDKLLFIDADIGFNPLDAYLMCQQVNEVIGGPYVQKRTDAVVFNVKPGDFIGTGFMKIERSALERMAEYAALVDGRPYFFNCGIYDGEYVGEDAAFCRDWRAIGGEIAVYPCKLTHYGRFGYTGDYKGLE